MCSIIGFTSKKLTAQSVRAYFDRTVSRGPDAMMVLELDGAPSQADLDIIRQIPDIRSCTFLKRRDD